MTTRFALATLVAAVGVASSANANVLAYWNFNNSLAGSPTTNLGVLQDAYPYAANSGSGTISTNGSLNSSNTSPNGDVGTFGGSTINALNSDPTGGALTFVNTGGAWAGGTGYFQFNISTLNASNLVMSFATRRSNSGFNSVQVSYSTNGTTFTNFGAAFDPTASFIAESFDFSAVTVLNNKANAYIRLTFGGAPSNGGNVRVDNVQFNATVTPAPGVLSLMGFAGLAAARRRR